MFSVCCPQNPRKMERRIQRFNAWCAVFYLSKIVHFGTFSVVKPSFHYLKIDHLYAICRFFIEATENIKKIQVFATKPWPSTITKLGQNWLPQLCKSDENQDRARSKCRICIFDENWSASRCDWMETQGSRFFDCLFLVSVSLELV